MAKVQVDTSVIAVFPYRHQLRLFVNAEPSELTYPDLEKIEKILDNAIKRNNSNRDSMYHEVHSKIDLANYKRQYVAARNHRNEIEVWVNCFCDAQGKDWKTDIILMLDGGHCYFNVKVNLTNGSYYDFIINSDT